jgi:nucleoid DNA-binding protein
MTKRDMAKAIADRMGLPKGQVREVIQGVFGGITEVLVSEGRLELRNFGVFEVKGRRPMRARNPRTGEAVDVPARLVVTFKAGREMGERVGRLAKVPGRAAASAPPEVSE